MSSVAGEGTSALASTSISVRLADLRAAFRRELRRLHARPVDGGPMDAVREGALLAFFPPLGQSYTVTHATVAALNALPNGAGVERVKEVLS